MTENVLDLQMLPEAEYTSREGEQNGCTVCTQTCYVTADEDD